MTEEMQEQEQTGIAEPGPPKPKRKYTRRAVAAETAPKKRRKYRHRRPAPPVDFDMLLQSASLVSALQVALLDSGLKNERVILKALTLIQKAVQDALLANPAQLFARLAGAMQNGHANGREATAEAAAETRGEAAAPAPTPNRVRTVAPDSPIISLTDLDLFIAEETPGRFFQVALGPREVPVIFMSREEYGALRKELAENAGDMDSFKRDLQKVVPDELLAPFLQQAMALYKGCVIRI